MRKTTQKTHGQMWKAAFVFLAVFAWVAIPFLTQNKVEASGEPPVSTITANLTAPNGAINPHGLAAYNIYASGNRELEVEVEDVNAADGTVFTAFVDNIAVGNLTISQQKGRLKLRTEDGQSVPAVNGGSIVSVKSGTTTIVSGTFGGGNATPSPTVSPTGSPSPSPSVSPTVSPGPTVSPSPSPTVSPTPNGSDLFAALTGATVNGALPGGFAQYEIHSSRRELEISVRQVNLPIGTPLAVSVDSAAVGQLILASAGEGRLRLRSDNGQTVPNVVAGSTITIKNGTAAILSGTFAGATASPSPSPSPNAQPGRYFEANLSGSGVTPPVSALGRSEMKISLNAGETEAQLFGEFENLSSAQTSAKIIASIGTTTTIVDLGAITSREGEAHFQRTFAVTPTQVQQLRAGLWFAVIGTVNNPNGEIQGQFRNHASHSDFDGDGRSDLAVFRPSEGAWYFQNGAGFGGKYFGAAADKVVSADYDGDGKTDTAIFRNVNGIGIWDISRSSDGGTTTQQFGFASDTTVRSDFDGDGRSDIAVYRPSNGGWYIQKSDNTGYIFVQFGASEDKPFAVDIDGDGKDDICVFRPSNGAWYWLRSSDGGFSGAYWGTSGDVPVAGDFDGDGKTDLSVYRPSDGVWYIRHSSDGTFDFRQFGAGEDVPVAGNYDGDDKTDIAVFRPSDGVWYIWRSVDGTFDFRAFGMNGDVPTPSR